MNHPFYRHLQTLCQTLCQTLSKLICLICVVFVLVCSQAVQAQTQITLAQPVQSASHGIEDWWLMAYQSFVDGNWEIYTYKLDGAQHNRLTHEVAADSQPRLNHDASRIVFVSARSGNDEIYVMNADGAHPAPLTQDGASDSAPAWSPDGKQIVFVSERFGNPELMVMNADGSSLTRLTTHPHRDLYPSWSPDGKQIAWLRIIDQTTGELWVMNVNGSSQRAIRNRLQLAKHTVWSPDGQRIAFDFDDNGDKLNEPASVKSDGTDLQVYQRSSLSEKKERTVGGWSPTSSTLYFTTAQLKIEGNTVEVISSQIESICIVIACAAGEGETLPPTPTVSSAPDVQRMDRLAPTSRVIPLAEFTRRDALQVGWYARDFGLSGVWKLSLFAKHPRQALAEWEKREKCHAAEGGGCPAPLTDIGFGNQRLLNESDTGKWYFYTVATDAASNQQTPPGRVEDGVSTTIFSWLLVGRVSDNRGYPVAGQTFKTQPATLDTPISNLSGEYLAHLPSTAKYRIGAWVELQIGQDTDYSWYIAPTDSVLQNGGFEEGSQSWQVPPTSTISPTVTSEFPHTGNAAALLGCILACPATALNSGAERQESALQQQVILPNSLHRPTLSFLYQFQNQTDRPGSPSFHVTVQNGVESKDVFIDMPDFSIPDADTIRRSRWKQGTVNLEAWSNQTVTITFALRSDVGSEPWAMTLDDVSLGSWRTPVPKSVAPVQNEVGVTVTLTIAGDNFIATPDVRLYGKSLANVQWIDPNTLQVALPASTPPGYYNLEVINPGGEKFILPAAFAVGYQVFLPMIER